MLTSRRDYILRLIDEVSRLLARVLLKRREGQEQEALHTIVQACERLFSLEAHQLFQFTPDQHYLMLTRDEPPEIARQKVLIYAALSAEAGHVYQKLGNRTLACASFTTALRLSLKARAQFGSENLPDFAPPLPALLASLAEEPLDADTQTLLAAANLHAAPPNPSKQAPDAGAP